MLVSQPQVPAPAPRNLAGSARLLQGQRVQVEESAA